MACFSMDRILWDRREKPSSSGSSQLGRSASALAWVRSRTQLGRTTQSIRQEPSFHDGSISSPPRRLGNQSCENKNRGSCSHDSRRNNRAFLVTILAGRLIFSGMCDHSKSAFASCSMRRRSFAAIPLPEPCLLWRVSASERGDTLSSSLALCFGDACRY